jgi:hypothetical protein
MSQLRLGRRVNPSSETMKAIAEYFHVKLEYFTDDDYYAMIDAQVRWTLLMREDDVRRIALGAAELTPATRQKVADLVDSLQYHESLDIAPASTSSVADPSEALCPLCEAQSSDVHWRRVSRLSRSST